MVERSVVRMSVAELADRIRKKEVSPVEATKESLEAIERLNPTLNAFTTVCADLALEQATRAEAEIVKGNWRGPMHGIPFGVKDLTDTAGVATQYGLGAFKGYVPEEDATIVRLLKEAGGIMVGKTATHEIGLGITTNNAFFGPTRNPWDTERIPGGSSGGSAAAIAADMIVASTGNDGGGSIRIPSFYCGVTGLKPTHGLVSRFGLMGWGTTSFATEGPICKTVMDCAIMLKILAGRDELDPFTVRVETPDYPALVDGGVKGLKVGVSEDLFLTEFDGEVKAAYERAAKLLVEGGAEVVEVRVPNQQLAASILPTILGGEMALIHRQWTREREIEYSPQVALLVEAALAVSLEDYVRAGADRERLRRDYDDVFAEVDVLLGPISPVPAPKIGEDAITVNGQQYDLLMAVVSCTGAGNLVGLPSVATPVGFTHSGLPLGVQIMAKHFNEVAALRAARAIERAVPEVSGRRPPL